MPFAAALSEHPLATHAVGEVVGQLLDSIGTGADLVVLFAGAAHTGAMEDIAGAIRTLLQPKVLVGSTSSTVLGGAREVEDAGGLSVWAARGVHATARHLTGPRLDDLPGDVRALLVLADPFSFPVDELLAATPVPVIGGLASAARGPGGNRLLLDGEVHVDGAVAVALRGAEIETVVSQGCRPIGDPLVVTKGEGRLVLELAGRPALSRVQEVIAALPRDTVELARRGLHVGRVVDESKATFGRGDFLVRDVLGADRRIGAVAIGGEVEVGATIQFQVRDAHTADEDLRFLMYGREAASALVFTCRGRGTDLFGEPDHDATVITEALEGAPLAGMSCAGEIGPVGGRSFLHGFTASIALFSDAQVDLRAMRP